MIDDISGDDVARLAQADDSWLVSIHMPTHRAGEDGQQDPIRLRNLLRAARSELSTLACPSSVAGDRLAPLDALVDDRDFWANVDTGLAIFSGPSGQEIYRLEVVTPELVVVADRYHVKPLLLGVTTSRTYHVLVLSQNAVRLFRGGSNGLREIQDDRIPRRTAEALANDDRERQLTSHSSGRVGQGRVTAAFHGQGAPADSRDSDLTRFLRLVDEGVRSVTSSSPASPLILAGVAEDQHAYRSLTAHEYVADKGLTGSADRLSASVLHTLSWPIASHLFAQGHRDAAEAFSEAKQQTLHKLAPTLEAAAAGRVETLFVPIGRHDWATVDANGAIVDRHVERAAGDNDLFNVAALETIRHRGEVYAVGPAGVPGGGDVAAILRY